MSGGAEPRRRWIRRIVSVVVVAAQLTLVVLAYGADHAVFGFQMFPESSEWQAEVVRVTADGRIVDIRDEWPGGYRWDALVGGRGLSNPFDRSHADAGLASTLDFLDHALDWVADNTPADTETLYLEARVTVWDNGRGPDVTTLRSDLREEVER
jgi:hypothetical protein